MYFERKLRPNKMEAVFLLVALPVGITAFSALR